MVWLLKGSSTPLLLERGTDRPKTEGNQCTVEIYRLDRWPMHRCWFALWCTGSGCVASFASRFPNKSAKDDWPGGAFGGREDGGGNETPETRACEANVSKNFSILNFYRMVLKGFLFCFNRIFVKEVVEVEKMKWTAGWGRFLCILWINLIIAKEWKGYFSYGLLIL